ncbi:MAG: dihydrofolate reductase [Robiginitomaculum sp.]|nr:dihydrofolate reductase [Robiginitomaculum sp.]
MKTQAKLSIIVAAGLNNVIGKDGDMPWRLSADMVHFKRITAGKPVLMGRKTWQSLFVQPLPGRENLVLSRDVNLPAKGAEVFNDMDAMIAKGKALAGVDGEVMVIGGGVLYEAVLPLCDRVYFTRVNASPDGDTYFPELDPKKWRLVQQQPYPSGDKDDHAFVTQVFEKVG